MNRRMFVAGMGATALGGSALLATGGSSRVESQRGATIQIVGDDEAYLRLVYSPDAQSVSCDGTIELVTITNQLKETIDELEIQNLAVESDDLEIREHTITIPDRIDVGENGQIRVDVECEPGTDTTSAVSFDIVARGIDQAVIAKGHVDTRTVEVDCECAPSTTLLDETAISFIAFCNQDGGSVTVSAVEVTHENTDDEPTGVRWETDEPVTEVVLYGGRKWRIYNYPEGSTTGTVTMSGNDADNAISNDQSGPPSADFGDGVGVGTPSKPCGCGASTKLEEKYDFAIAAAEKNDGDC